MISNKEFADIFTKFINNYSHKEICKHLKIEEETINEWILGNNIPSQVLRERIIIYICKKIMEK